MTSTTTIRPITRTLDAPGATLAYDVRPNDTSRELPLVLIGSPMGAAGFGTLSRHFTDRSVVTYDPRGSERSLQDAQTQPASPDVHADDVRRVIEAVGGGPIDLFASSGGAINALALVARRPKTVRTLVAHEPPLFSGLPDHAQIDAATRAVHETYLRRGWGAGMAHFIAMTSHEGPFTAEFAARPAPDPATFGFPTEDDGSRDDPLLGADPGTEPTFAPDFGALTRATTRIVIAAGEESRNQMTGRAAAAVAERLGVRPEIFPSNHGGFLGGEYGQTGKPDEFAAKLREVLGNKG